MATTRQTNDEIQDAIRRSYIKGIGDPDSFLMRDRLTTKVGYLKSRVESCRREAEALPRVEEELAAAMDELERFNAGIGA